VLYPTVPSYVYTVRLVDKAKTRGGLLVDVDLGFRHWRRNLPLTLAGTGITKAAAALEVGERYVVRTSVRGRGYVAQLAPGIVPSYTYAAVLGVAHDADTVRADIDLGFDEWVEGQPVRLTGGNARELAEPGGVEAAANLRAVAPAGARVVLRSLRADKYGDRYGGRITLPDGDDLTERLIAGGWMALWSGRGVKPVPPWPRLA
jgi:endonuclease YncB( thermonuclease family)